MSDKMFFTILVLVACFAAAIFGLCWMFVVNPLSTIVTIICVIVVVIVFKAFNIIP